MIRQIPESSTQECEPTTVPLEKGRYEKKNFPRISLLAGKSARMAINFVGIRTLSARASTRTL